MQIFDLCEQRKPIRLAKVFITSNVQRRWTDTYISGRYRRYLRIVESRMATGQKPKLCPINNWYIIIPRSILSSFLSNVYKMEFLICLLSFLFVYGIKRIIIIWLYSNHLASYFNKLIVYEARVVCNSGLLVLSIFLVEHILCYTRAYTNFYFLSIFQESLVPL